MNNQPQTAAEFSFAAKPTSAISTAPINGALSEQPVGDAVCLPELTAIDGKVVATEQASANDAQNVEPEQEPENYSPSDVGNAERFVFEWRETTRFDAGRRTISVSAEIAWSRWLSAFSTSKWKRTVSPAATQMIGTQSKPGRRRKKACVCTTSRH